MHEMSSPVFWQNNNSTINWSSTEFVNKVVKVNYVTVSWNAIKWRISPGSVLECCYRDLLVYFRICPGFVS